MAREDDTIFLLLKAIVYTDEDMSLEGGYLMGIKKFIESVKKSLRLNEFKITGKKE